VSLDFARSPFTMYSSLGSTNESNELKDQSPSDGIGDGTLWRWKMEYSRIRRYKDLSESDYTRKLTDEMKQFIQEWKKADVDPFWHRKSRKVVLCVLMIRLSKKVKFYRGINTEISLPSGSNCAERAAISSAISRKLGIQRRDFQSLAVIDPTDELNPVSVCGVCEEWLKKIQEESPHFTVVTYKSIECDEVIERFPLFYTQEQILREAPEPLRESWQCESCHTFNEPPMAKCALCQNPRPIRRGLTHRPSKRIVCSDSPEAIDLEHEDDEGEIVDISDSDSGRSGESQREFQSPQLVTSTCQALPCV